MGIFSWRNDFKWRRQTALAELVDGWTSCLKTTASSKFRNNLQVGIKVTARKHVEISILQCHNWRSVKTVICDEDEQTGRKFLSINVHDSSDMQWNPEPWTPTDFQAIKTIVSYRIHKLILFVYETFNIFHSTSKHLKVASLRCSKDFCFLEEFRGSLPISAAGILHSWKNNG